MCMFLGEVRLMAICALSQQNQEPKLTSGYQLSPHLPCLISKKEVLTSYVFVGVHGILRTHEKYIYSPCQPFCRAEATQDIVHFHTPSLV